MEDELSVSPWVQVDLDLWPQWNLPITITTIKQMVVNETLSLFWQVVVLQIHGYK